MGLTPCGTTTVVRHNASALLAYVQRMLPGDPNTHRAEAWDPGLVSAIETEREAIRVQEGGSGMCHLLNLPMVKARGF